MGEYMKRKGFTLVELIVSIVLVGIVLASMIGTLLSLKNTYNVVNEDMEARTYSTLVSKIINEHIMKNNGIKDYDCAGNKCVMTLGTLDKNGNNKKMTLEIVTATLKSNVMKDNKNNSNVGSLMEKTTTIKYYGEDYSYYKTLKYYDRHYAEGNKDIITGYKFKNIKGTAYLYGKPDTELKDYLVNITIEMNNPKYNIEVYSTSEVKNADVGNLRLYKLTYNSNGGSTCPDNPKVALDRKPWGELCVPTKPQSGFKGWFIQKDGVFTKEVTAESIALEDINVYAHWDNNKYSCAAGKYLPAGKTSCETCLENNYCPGITDVYYDKFHDQGISKCLTNYLSASGSKVKTDCKITCNEGSHLKKANDTSCTGCLTGYEKGRHEVSWGNISACNIVDPGKPSISGGSTKIYGSSDTTLTCSTPSTYESNTSIYYSFGYSSTETGTLGNWSDPITTNTLVVSKTEYVGNRYYACRVYASGSGTSNTITSNERTLLRIKNAEITFNKNIGEINPTDGSWYTRTGANVFYAGEVSSTTKNAPTASKTGYKWNGWYTATSGGKQILNSSNTIQSTTVDGYIKSSKWTTTTDKQLYAQYSAKTYTLTYDCNEGTKPSGKLGNATATYDQVFKISTDVCTRTGYTQNGWNTKADGTGSPWTVENTNNTDWKWNIDSNVTLYAVWNPNTYKITLDKNGGTNTPTGSVNVTYMTSTLSPSSITLPTRSYKVSGFGLATSRKSNGATVSSTSDITNSYTFDGWYTDKSSGNLLLSKAKKPILQASVNGFTDSSSMWTKAGGTTVYAHWSGGSVTLPTITKDGYNCGWTTSSTGTTITYASGGSYTPTAATTMYGVCVAKQYTITYHQGHGSLNDGKWTDFSKKTTCTFDSDCTLESYSNLGGTFPDASNVWSFAGWTAKANATAVSYSDSGSINPSSYSANVNLYAIGRRGFRYSSGEKPTTNSGYKYQYWNPYSTAADYYTSVDVAAANPYSGWDFIGYRATDTASSTVTIGSSYAGKSTYKPSPTSLTALNFRAIYSRKVYLKYYPNGGSGSKGDDEQMQYHNSGFGNGSSNTISGHGNSTATFTLAPSNTYTRAGYILNKWAEGSTSGAQKDPGSEYSWTPSGSDSTTKSMYATWSIIPTCTLAATSSGVKITANNADSYGLSKTNTATYNSTQTLALSESTYYGFVKTNAGNTGTCTIKITAADSSTESRDVNCNTYAKYNSPSTQCSTGYSYVRNTCSSYKYCSGGETPSEGTCSYSATATPKSNTLGCASSCPTGWNSDTSHCTRSCTCNKGTYNKTTGKCTYNGDITYSGTCTCGPCNDGSGFYSGGYPKKFTNVTSSYCGSASTPGGLCGNNCSTGKYLTADGYYSCNGKIQSSRTCSEDPKSCSWTSNSYLYCTTTEYTCSGGQTPSGTTCSYNASTGYQGTIYCSKTNYSCSSGTTIISGTTYCKPS